MSQLKSWSVPLPATLRQLALAVSLAGVAAHAQSIANLGVLPGGSYSRAVGVSGDGSVVVGVGNSNNGSPTFRWTQDGGMQRIGTYDSNAFGISADGSTIVGQADSVPSGWRAFRWTTASGMEYFGSSGTYATAVSADGTVTVGQMSGGNGSFRYTASSYQYLGGFQACSVSGDGTAVVGRGATEPYGPYQIQAFQLTPAVGLRWLGVIPGGYGSEALGVSADGSVVVGSAYSPIGVRAFRWTAELRMESLGKLASGVNSFATAVSGDGSIVVGYADSDGSNVAFIWHASFGMMSLKDYLSSKGVDLTGWSELSTATAISANGRFVVGNGVFEGANRAFIAEIGFIAAPCPSDLDDDGSVGGSDISLALLAFGACSTTASCPADLDGDAEVTTADISLLLMDFGDCPIWYSVLEQAPDPAVVWDATLRAAITATGKPWRVRDNGTGIEMVLIPPGTFTMGCSASNGYGCMDEEAPVHQVTLTNAFYMSRTEVTQAQWVAKMASNPSSSVNQVLPVDQVSWNDTQPFCKATALRLATEAEWEYAYRAGTTTAFHGMPGYLNGTNEDSQLGTIAWNIGNSGNQLHPVAGKAANGFGLYDMSGNAWEWCQDWWGAYAPGAQINPVGPSNGDWHVLRGGDFWHGATGCRASYRSDLWGPDNRNRGFGFRVVRNP
jgi:formylglycine-generating enzyme required for sulfatase activity/uncharacterized membrane protein